MTDPTEIRPKGLLLGDDIYSKMKFVVQIVLPALSTFYFTLGAVWDLPSVEQVIGTLAALATFFGVILGLSTKTYNSTDAKYVGSINIEHTEGGGKLYSLELKGDPEELDQKKEVTFKVGSPLPPPQP